MSSKENNIDNQNINKLIESGDYYIKAREWYNMKYVDIVYNSYFFLICLIITFILIIALFLSLIGVSEHESEMPFAIYFDKDTEKYYSTLTKMVSEENKDIKPEQLVYKLMIKNYIKDYESYIAMKSSNARLKNYNRIKRVLSQSNTTVSNHYKNMISKNNKKSYIRLYGANISRIITINNVQFLNNNVQSWKADVSFTAYLEKKGKQYNHQNYIATIDFYLTDIKALMESEQDKKELRLFVKGYEVHEKN